ncbi:LysR substrate-binding domain-containing protein [Streptomyces sp. 147326]|uniref:LysR substrate-binding domain-containing protein n=1 Tax=Streptomyces sp. 147326 TaxID=3074379 RepID=UPI0038573D23
MFDLHRLRLLRELKHRGTLAAVAAALSYSPSTISQQLSLLESEVGVRLLEHVGRRVRLTQQAEILVAHTEAVLERLERAETDIATSLTDLTGTLRIASFQSAALALVPTALNLLHAAHPLLRVHLTQMERESAISALLARDFDLIIDVEYPGIPGPRPAEVEQEELCEDTLHLAHPAIGGVADPMEALLSLAKQPWIMEPEGTVARRWSMALCRQAGFEPDIRYESTDHFLHLRLAEQGHAAALLPGLAWHGRPPKVPLQPLPRAHHRRRLLTAVRRGGGQHPTIKAARQALLGAAEQLVL